MKKLITAVFCTALALNSGFTAYAEDLDREYIETEIWDDIWNGKGDNGLIYPEASYKHHLLDEWLNENYGSDNYDWSEIGELKHAYKDYYRDYIENFNFEDDNNGNWTITTPEHSYSFTLFQGEWSMLDHLHQFHLLVGECVVFTIAVICFVLLINPSGKQNIMLCTVICWNCGDVILRM